MEFVEGQICRIKNTSWLKSKICRVLSPGRIALVNALRPWYCVVLLDDGQRYGIDEIDLSPITDPAELALIELAHPSV